MTTALWLAPLLVFGIIVLALVRVMWGNRRWPDPAAYETKWGAVDPDDVRRITQQAGRR